MRIFSNYQLFLLALTLFVSSSPSKAVTNDKNWESCKKNLTKRLNSLLISEYIPTDRNLNFMRKKVYPPHILDLKTLEGKKVLDAGCGGGSFVKDLRAQNIDIIGVDLRITPQNHLESNFLIHGDLAELPFDDQQFDQIFSTFTVFLENYEGYNKPFLRKVLSEFKRVLRPGGVVIIGGTANPIAMEIAKEFGFKLLEAGAAPDYFFKFVLN